jgi:hypothetical protein
MINSKKIYNTLNNTEINFFFKKQFFFVIQDSLNFSADKKLKLQNYYFKQLQKFIFKRLLFSNFLDFKTIKFPLYITFIKKSGFFEELFLRFLCKKNVIVFLKYKKQTFNLINTKISFNSSLELRKLNTLNFFLIRYCLYNSLLKSSKFK